LTFYFNILQIYKGTEKREDDMDKKTKKFLETQEDLVRNSYEMPPIEEIGLINHERLSNKFFIAAATSISCNLSDSDYEPADIDIKRMQMAIGSGFNDLPNGLTPDEIIEYIINN
jgi:hypothetical protein